METIYFHSDKKLLELAKSCCQEVPGVIRFGKIVTGEQFIENSRRQEINDTFSPLAVDMEASAISADFVIQLLSYI